MAIQEAFGKIGFFEDFQAVKLAVTIDDITVGTRYNDVTIIAISGAVAPTYTVDESGGVSGFSGASGAGDGVAITSSPMVPSSNGTIVVVARWKVSSASDYRFFLGWQETVNLAEAVNPFTLNGTGLTANSAGQVVGFYYDTQASVDGFRLMAASDGTEATSAALSYSRTGATTLGSLGILCGETLTADKWVVARVEIDPSGQVRAYLGDETMGNTTGLTHIATIKSGAIDEDAVYFPMIQMLEQSSGDPTHEIDYFGATGNRDWTL